MNSIPIRKIKWKTTDNLLNIINYMLRNSNEPGKKTGADTSDFAT